MSKPWLLALVLAVTLASPAAALDGLQAGMKAPPLSLDGLDGGRIGVGGPSSGRAVLAVFWATWSRMSPEVLERAEKLAGRHRSQGLAVVGINVEKPRPTPEEVQQVRAAAQRLALTFPVALDRELEAFHAYGVVAVPSSVLIGADGTVLGALVGYPIAGREDFFELVEATVLGRQVARRPEPRGPEPNPRAVRYFNLGRALAARGLADQADANLQKSIELDGAFALPRILLGQIYRERALTRETIALREGALQTLHRSDEERAGWLRLAEQQLGEAARLDPGSAAALTELAQVHSGRGDLARARELVERALKADPAYSPARSHLGALLLAAGAEELGRAELAAAIQMNPLDWRLHITAAEAYERHRLTKDAIEEYRRGIELLWQARGAAMPGAR